jgi:hypothetical protein
VTESPVVYRYFMDIIQIKGHNRRGTRKVKVGRTQKTQPKEGQVGVPP